MADSKISALTALAEQPATGDLAVIVDVSDTTDAATGTTKKITYDNLIPDASTTVEGKVELATDAETVTGTDTVRATTPANITAKMAAPGTIGGTTPGAATFTTITGTTITTSANIELGNASDTTISRASAGVVAIEGNNVVVNASSPTLGTLTTTGNIELGHASDTTLARVSAGVASLEGVNLVTVSSTDTLSNKTLTAPKFADTGFIADGSGNEQIKFSTTASAVNELTVKNAATGNPPQIQATGGDTDVGITLVPKGAGIVKGELKRFMVRLLESATALTTGNSKGGDYRISNRAITVKAVGMYLDTAATGATLTTVDINEAGTTILSTKITTDASEKSSETAATPPVISDSAIAADAVITFDIDAIGNTTPGNGLTVWIDYVYA